MKRVSHKKKLQPQSVLLKAHLRNMTGGEREPNFETLKKIAQYFQTTTDYLLGLSEVMHPDKTRQLAISVPLGYDLTSTEEEVIEIAREFFACIRTISVIPVEQKEKVYSFD